MLCARLCQYLEDIYRKQQECRTALPSIRQAQIHFSKASCASVRQMLFDTAIRLFLSSLNTHGNLCTMMHEANTHAAFIGQYTATQDAFHTCQTRSDYMSQRKAGAEVLHTVPQLTTTSTSLHRPMLCRLPKAPHSTETTMVQNPKRPSCQCFCLHQLQILYRSWHKRVAATQDAGLGHARKIVLRSPCSNQTSHLSARPIKAWSSELSEGQMTWCWTLLMPTLHLTKLGDDLWCVTKAQAKLDCPRHCQQALLKISGHCSATPRSTALPLLAHMQ